MRITGARSDLADTHHHPLWLMRAAGIRPVAYSNIKDASAYEYLREITAKLPAPKEVTIRERGEGRIERSANKPTETLRPKPHHLALMNFANLASLSSTPLSALEWKRRHVSDLGVPDDVWLLLVIQAETSPRKEFAKLQYKRVEQRGASHISRNLFVTDVLVHGR